MNLIVFQTMAYTNKYSLPDESQTREILIRRHASVRRSVRAGSFRELVGGDKKGGDVFSVSLKSRNFVDPHSCFSPSLIKTSPSLRSITPCSLEGIWRVRLPSEEEVVVVKRTVSQTISSSQVRLHAPHHALWSLWGGWTPSKRPANRCPLLGWMFWTREVLEVWGVLVSEAGEHRFLLPGGAAQVTKTKTTLTLQERLNLWTLLSYLRLVHGHLRTRTAEKMEPEILCWDTRHGALEARGDRDTQRGSILDEVDSRAALEDELLLLVEL